MSEVLSHSCLNFCEVLDDVIAIVRLQAYEFAHESILRPIAAGLMDRMQVVPHFLRRIAIRSVTLFDFY
jgi:hypothetical protein